MEVHGAFQNPKCLPPNERDFLGVPNPLKIPVKLHTFL